MTWEQDVEFKQPWAAVRPGVEKSALPPPYFEQGKRGQRRLFKAWKGTTVQGTETSFVQSLSEGTTETGRVIQRHIR